MIVLIEAMNSALVFESALRALSCAESVPVNDLGVERMGSLCFLINPICVFS